MSFSEALHQELDRRTKADANAKAVQDSLPENPERGSYFWWASIARQNTGQALCDSGSHYGYAYERPVPANDLVTLDFYKGQFEGATINTIEWLTEQLDASDPTARAIEKLVYWIASLYPRDPWPTVFDKINKDLDDLAAVLDEGKHAIFAYFVRPRLTDLPRTYKGRWGDFALDLMDAFPADAIQTIMENGYGRTIDAMHITGGTNTYNNESDLSQVVQWYGIEIENLSEGPYFTYILVQTHNGFDVRGGYSDPVVARVCDESGLYFTTTNLHCQECGHDWDLTYRYTENIGQLETAPDSAADPAPSTDTFDSMPVDTALYCPECGNYSVYVWTF